MTFNNNRIFEIIDSIKDTNLFSAATTHKSYLKAYPNLKSYEELIPQGEEILNAFISSFLESSHKGLTLEELNLIKSELIDAKYFKHIFKEVNFDKIIKAKTTKSGPIKIAVFKSLLVPLYFEKGSVILFEFLTLTILNNSKFKDKLHNFNPLLVPPIHMKGVINEIQNPQITDTPNLIDNKLPIQNLALTDKSQNFSENVHDKNFVKSNEFKEILERLRNLEHRLTNQIHSLENPNNLKTSELNDSNPILGSQNSKDLSNIVEDHSKIELVAKTSFIFFNLFILLTVVSSLILFFNYSDVFPDDSSFQLLNKLSNKMIKAKFNSGNEQISTSENPLENNTNVSEIKENISDVNEINPLENKEIKIPIIFNNLSSSENLQIIDKVRSLYLKDNGENFNIFPINDDKPMVFYNPNSENKLPVEIQKDSALVTYILGGFALTTLFFLHKYISNAVSNALSNVNFNFFNFPGFNTNTQIPDQIEITPRSIDPDLIPKILEKSKKIIEIGEKYLDEIGKTPGIELITTNIFGLLFYLLDPLEEPLEKPKDVHILDSESSFDKYPGYESKNFEDVYDDDFDSKVKKISDEDSNPKIHIDSIEIDRDSTETKENTEIITVTVEEVIETEIEQMDQSVQTDLSYNSEINSLKNEIGSLSQLVSNQNSLIDQAENHISTLSQGLQEAKESIDSRDNIISNQGALIDDQANSIRQLENKIELIKTSEQEKVDTSIQTDPPKDNSEVAKAIRNKIKKLKNKIKSQEETIEGYKKMEQNILANNAERDTKLEKFELYRKENEEMWNLYNEHNEQVENKANDISNNWKNGSISREEARKQFKELSKDNFDWSNFDNKWKDFLDSLKSQED